MNPNPFIKTLPFDGFTLHHLFFKKMQVTDFEVVADIVSAYLYSNQASLIQVYIAGPEKDQKPWNKACMQTFGEVNWPLCWINLPETQRESSACITCVSGQTVKTLLGNNFISKIIDAPDCRFGIAGATNKPVTLGAPLVENLAEGLLFTGCETTHLLKAWIPTHIFSRDKTTGNNPVSESQLPLAVIPVDPSHPDAVFHSLWAMKTHHPELSIQKNTVYNNYGTFYPTVINHRKSRSLMLSGSFPLGENSLEQVLSFLGEMLQEQGFDWNHCARGVWYCHPSENEKALKELFKSRKIPLAPWLFVPGPSIGQESQFWFDADFVWEIE